MKKQCICIIMISIFLLLSGCNSNNNSYTVKDGEYLMEQPLIGSPVIKISNEKFFISDLTSNVFNFGISGTYLVKDDILTMTADDNEHIFVFHIVGNNLIFQKSESSPDDYFEIRIADKAKFQPL